MDRSQLQTLVFAIGILAMVVLSILTGDEVLRSAVLAIATALLVLSVARYLRYRVDHQVRIAGVYKSSGSGREVTISPGTRTDAINRAPSGLGGQAYRGKLCVDAEGWHWTSKGRKAPSHFDLPWADVDVVDIRGGFGIGAIEINLKARSQKRWIFWMTKSPELPGLVQRYGGHLQVH